MARKQLWEKTRLTREELRSLNGSDLDRFLILQAVRSNPAIPRDRVDRDFHGRDRTRLVNELIDSGKILLSHDYRLSPAPGPRSARPKARR